MKFAINGAYTIASYSGANIEMAERLGAESIITFGHKKEGQNTIRDYKPSKILDSHELLQTIFSFLDEILPSFPDGNLVTYPSPSQNAFDRLCNQVNILHIHSRFGFIQKCHARSQRYHLS